MKMKLRVIIKWLTIFLNSLIFIKTFGTETKVNLICESFYFTFCFKMNECYADNTEHS